MNKRMQQKRTDNRGRRTEVRDQVSVFCLLFSVFWFLACALLPAGCAQQPSTQIVVKKMQDGALYVSTGHPTAEQNSEISMVDLMEVAEEVLARMHFTIEKADLQNGIIRTRPLPGAQFFEFWRSDNVGSYNTLAANLHTIRRTVTLNISQKPEDRRQKPDNGKQKTEDRPQTSVFAARHPVDGPLSSVLRIGCDVQVQRLSLPERQVSSSARVYGMFSRSSPSLQRLQLNPEQKKKTAWIDLGSDTRLAVEILKRIETQIARRTNHKLQTTESET